MTRYPPVTTAMQSYAQTMRWRMQSAPDGSAEPCVFSAPDGALVVFRTRSGSLVRPCNFPANTTVGPVAKPVRIPRGNAAGTITVGELRDLLDHLPADKLLRDAGLEADWLGQVAKMLALAPTPQRIQAQTRKISRGFWVANSPEALGL